MTPPGHWDGWSPEERRALAPPERLTVSEWAERYMVLSDRKKDAEAGRFDPARCPYQREPMDAMGDPEIETVVLRAAAQVGKSTILRAALGYWADQDPGPALIVYPNEKAAQEQLRERVLPMFQDSPRLSGLITGNRADSTIYTLALASMPIWAAWTGSPQAVAARPCRFLICDETDKYQRFSGSDASPIALAKARTRTFGHRRKHVMASTPTTDQGNIWREWLACADRRHYHVPCPRCGVSQILTWPQIKHRSLRDAADPRTELPLDATEIEAWYECQHCHGRIEEWERQDMARLGRWVSEGFEQAPDRHPPSRRRAYHISGLIVTLGSQTAWAELVAKFLQVKNTPELLMEFVNQELGDPFFDQAARVETKPLEARSVAIGHPYGVVPAWASVLLASADTQRSGHPWVLRAWGGGDCVARSRLIAVGEAKNLDDLARTIFARWPIEGSAETMAPSLLVIDAGGGIATDTDANMTELVYRWTSRDPSHRLATRGMGGLQRYAQPLRLSQRKYARPGKGVAAFAVRCLMIDTTWFKDALAARINYVPKEGEADPWELCDGLPREYFLHMQSEHKIRERSGQQYAERWVLRSHGRQNHWWDCEVSQLAAATFLETDRLPPAATVARERLRAAEVRSAVSTRRPVAPVRNFTPMGNMPFLANHRR